MRQFSEGALNSKIVIVGEYLGEQEIRNRRPFSGPSGWHLDQLMQAAGINRDACYLTNVLHEIPPYNKQYGKREAKEKGIPNISGLHVHPKLAKAREEIKEELRQLEPNVIILMGDYALWAVMDIPDGVDKWRGSILESEFGKVIPTYNPVTILGNFPNRWLIGRDLEKAAYESLFPEVRKPDWKFLIRPSFSEAMEALEYVRGKKSAWDTETRGGQISCIGFATSKTEAFCIPLMTREGNKSYFSDEEEYQLTLKLLEVLMETPQIWQNSKFDLTMLAKQYGILPATPDDTMIMMHVAYPGLLKSLNFQASLFCKYYCYWKDDNKGEKDDNTENDTDHWVYNCMDCCYTFENYEVLKEALEAYNLMGQYEKQKELIIPVLKMELRGMKVDGDRKRRLSGELLLAQRERMEWLEFILGHPFNPRSPKQMQNLFYEDLGMRVIKDRKTKQPTTNSYALNIMKDRQPLLAPLIDCIEEIRSLGVFKSTFADAKLDWDGRMRTSINITGAETFRFSSKKNIFGTGMNMQNIPSGTEED